MAGRMANQRFYRWVLYPHDAINQAWNGSINTTKSRKVAKQISILC